MAFFLIARGPADELTLLSPSLAASRQDALAELSRLTGTALVEARDLFEAQGAQDGALWASAALSSTAASLMKIANDVRLMASGPRCGLGELTLPAVQPGSSIMPGKVNPVIPEAVTQAALLAISHDQAVTLAAALGSLELNPFLPLVAHALLESLDVLARACDILRRHCVAGIEVDEARCRAQVENATATATALLPLLGYERASALVEEAERTGRGLKEVALSSGGLTEAQFDELTSAEAVGRLGFRPKAAGTARSGGSAAAGAPGSGPEAAGR